MDINRAVALAATSRRAELRRVSAEAVARGANNTGCTAGVERSYGTLRLPTLALMRLPDLALCAHLLDTVGERGEDPLVAARLGRQAADDDDVPVALDKARSATLALTRATAATSGDRMPVVEQLAMGWDISGV